MIILGVMFSTVASLCEIFAFFLLGLCMIAFTQQINFKDGPWQHENHFWRKHRMTWRSCLLPLVALSLHVVAFTLFYKNTRTKFKIRTTPTLEEPEHAQLNLVNDRLSHRTVVKP